MRHQLRGVQTFAQVRVRLSAVVISLFAFASAVAADGMKATVTASGSAEVLPVEFHVVLTFRQKGADAKAALAALKASRDQALAKLPGIDPAKAREETPTVYEKGGTNPMRAAIAAAQGQKVPRKAFDAEVTLQQVVRVPVALSGKDLLAITVEGENMKAVVHTSKAMPDQEADDDNDATMNYAAMMGAAAKQRGPVEFEFVAPRTAELEQKAYGQALKNAREKATSLATAAGLKSAEVVSITVQEPEAATGGNDFPMSYYRMMMGIGAVSEKKAESVVSGDTPALSVKATLMVECLLK